MKSAIKIFLWILLAIFVLIIGVIVWITCFLNLNHYKPRISRMIHTQTGYEVSLKGDISWSLYPTLGLSLTEVQVLDKDNPGNVLVDLGHMHLSLDMRALRRHEIKVTEIIVQGLDLSIVYGGPEATKTDTKSTTVATAEQKKTTSPAPAEKSSLDTANNSDTDGEESESKLMERLSKAEIERVLIENSNIFLVDKTTGQIYTLNSIRLETAHIKLGSPIDFSLSTRLMMPSKKSMDVNLSTRLFMEQGMTFIQLNPFKLILDQDSFEGHFRLDRATAPWKFQMVLASQEFDWSRFLKDSKQQINMKDIKANINMSFDLKKVDIAKSLEGDIQLSSGELSFNGVSMTDKAMQLLALRQMFVNNQASLGDLLGKAKTLAQNAYTPSKSTMMKNFQMKSQIKDSVMKSDIEISGDQYLMFGNGTLGFNQALDFKIFLGLPEQKDKNLPTLVIPFKIKGSVAEPEISVDEKGLLDQVDVIMRARLNDEVQKKIKDQAGGLLKKFGR